MLVDVAQNSVEWLEMRKGCCTASRMGDVLAVLKKASKNGKAGDPGAARIKYAIELVAERLTGRAVDHYVSMYMEEGLENEPLARAAYEHECDVEVAPGQFAWHPRINYCGASSDGLVGKDGLVEFKCLKDENHIAGILDGVIPDEYHPQLLGQLACYERKWVDFCLFNPAMPKPLRLWIKRMERDEVVEQAIAGLETEVESFLGEVADRLTRLANRSKEMSCTQEQPFPI